MSHKQGLEDCVMDFCKSFSFYFCWNKQSRPSRENVYPPLIEIDNQNIKKVKKWT